VSTTTGGVKFIGLNTGTKVGVLGDNASSVSNVSFNMATVSDAFNLLLDGGVKGAATIISSNGSTTMATINSTGAANAVGLITLTGSSADSITSLTLNAATNLTARLGQADYASSGALTVTGAGKVDLGKTLGFDGATINAVANSGDLTIALSSNINSFVGGTGADRVSATLITSVNASIFKNFELIDLAEQLEANSLINSLPYLGLG
jgi:hypothetical protein